MYRILLKCNRWRILNGWHSAVCPPPSVYKKCLWNGNWTAAASSSVEYAYRMHQIGFQQFSGGDSPRPPSTGSLPPNTRKEADGRGIWRKGDKKNGIGRTGVEREGEGSSGVARNLLQGVCKVVLPYPPFPSPPLSLPFPSSLPLPLLPLRSRPLKYS